MEETRFHSFTYCLSITVEMMYSVVVLCEFCSHANTKCAQCAHYCKHSKSSSEHPWIWSPHDAYFQKYLKLVVQWMSSFASLKCIWVTSMNISMIKYCNVQNMMFITQKSVGRACHISFLSLYLPIHWMPTSSAGSSGMADNMLMNPGSHLLTVCFYWLPLWLWPDQDNAGRESRRSGSHDLHFFSPLASGYTTNSPNLPF